MINIILTIWLLLIPVGFFIFLLGLTIDKEPLTFCGGIILGLFIFIAIILYLIFILIKLGVF